jgi:hypothetical protein
MSNVDFLVSRALQERRQADASSDMAVRDVHRMLVERYFDEAWSLNEADDNAPPMDEQIWRH